MRVYKFTEMGVASGKYGSRKTSLTRPGIWHKPGLLLNKLDVRRSCDRQLAQAEKSG